MATNQTLSLPDHLQTQPAEHNTGAVLETPTTQASEAVVQGTPKQAAPADTVTSPTTPKTRSRTDTVKSATPTKPALPLMPIPKPATKLSPQQAATETVTSTADKDANAEKGESPAAAPEAQAAEDTPAPAPAPKPTSWAKLFAAKQQQAAAANGNSPGSSVSGDVPNGTSGVASTFSKNNTSSVAEAIRAYKVNSGGKTSYIEPRGLINTGNMCYMNSVSRFLFSSLTRTNNFRFCKF